MSATSSAAILATIPVVGWAASHPASRSRTVRSVQASGGWIEFGGELVQVPAQPVLHPCALRDQVFPVIDQQLQFP